MIQIVKISVTEKMDPLGKHGRAGPRLVELASSRRGVSDPLGEIKVIFGTQILSIYPRTTTNQFDLE